MFDAMEIRDEIDSTVERWAEIMPREIRRAADLARADLRGGPIYLDDDGESVSCFDDGARRFDFGAACETVAAWAESVENIALEIDYDDESGESLFETIDGTRDAILRGLFGPDLAPYL